MSWTMYSAEESEAQRVAKEAADKLIAENAAKEAQRVIDETAAKTLAEETIAKAAAGEVTRATNDDLALMTARETHSRDMRDIAESVKKLDMKDLRDVMDGKLHMTDSELATALAKKEEEKTAGRDGRTADGRTNGTTIQTIETEAALTAAGVGHNLEEEKKLAAREGRPLEDTSLGVAGFALAALGGGRKASAEEESIAPMSGETRRETNNGRRIDAPLGMIGSIGTQWDSTSHQDSFTEPASERKALYDTAQGLEMAVKDNSDRAVASELAMLINSNASKGEIEAKMAQLASAEQFTDKTVVTKNGTRLSVSYDGDGPIEVEKSADSGASYDSSGGNFVTDTISDMVGAATGGRMGGARHRRGGMNAPLDTAIGALALLEGAGGTKELKAMTALLTGGMDAGDPFALSSPQTPGRERSPDLGLFLA